MSAALSLATIAMVISQKAASAVTVERQVTASIGDPVTLPCVSNLTASVDWQYHRSPFEPPTMLFSNDKVYDVYETRFRVARTTSHDFSLTVVKAELDDSGLYTCIEDGGLGKKRTIPLLVESAAHGLGFSGTVGSQPGNCSEGTPANPTLIAFLVVMTLIAAAAIAIAFGVCIKMRQEAVGKSHMIEPASSGTEKPVSADVRRSAAEEQTLLDTTERTTGSVVRMDRPTNVNIPAVVDQGLSLTDSPLRSTEPSSTGNLTTTMDLNSSQSTVHPQNTVMPMLTFNKAAPSGNEVHGVCVVGDKLYVARSKQSAIDIYDRHTMTPTGRLPVTGPGSDYPGCMAFDSGRQLFYISYFRAKTVRRIRLADGDCKAWSVTGEPDGVAVTSRGVLVTLRNEGKLVEFEPDGKLIREIHIDTSVNKPRHAIPYSVDEFLVCFGFGGGTCGMCLVNGQGTVVKFVDPKTEHPLHVVIGRNNSVLVAGFTGNNITMLDNRLEYVMDAIPKGDVHQPFRLCVDRDCEKLYVGDYKGGCCVFHISYK